MCAPTVCDWSTKQLNTPKPKVFRIRIVTHCESHAQCSLCRRTYIQYETMEYDWNGVSANDGSCGNRCVVHLRRNLCTGNYIQSIKWHGICFHSWSCHLIADKRRRTTATTRCMSQHITSRNEYQHKTNEKNVRCATERTREKTASGEKTRWKMSKHIYHSSTADPRETVCAIHCVCVFFFFYRCKRIALTQVWQWLVCAVKLKWMWMWMWMRTRKLEKVWLKLAGACIRENR